jgi:hypothetical protein
MFFFYVFLLQHYKDISNILLIYILIYTSTLKIDPKVLNSNLAG